VILSPLRIPGLFVTGTDTGVGKTMIAGAIADWFARRKFRVAVCKLAATGCVHRREGLVSEDAEFLAHCAKSRHPLDLICPQRYSEPLAPAIAARRAMQPLDWSVIDNSIRLMSQDSDVMIIEGVGGVMVPMDEKYTVLDAIAALKIPAVVVARAGLGTINHTLLTVNALRQREIAISGCVINGYPPDLKTVAEETNPRAITDWGGIPILCIVPQFTEINAPYLPGDLIDIMQMVDWNQLISK
jgi:dethiobiotin synthetase